MAKEKDLIELYGEIDEDVNIINDKFNEAINESKDLDDFYKNLNKRLVEAGSIIEQRVVDKIMEGAGENINGD